MMHNSSDSSPLTAHSSPYFMLFKSRLLLGLVTLGVSMVLGLLTTRDFGKAVLTGSTSLFACLVGLAVAEKQHRQALTQRAEELRSHIRALQRRRAETYQSLMLMVQERDQVSNSLNSLHSQLRGLQIQSANLWQQKEELSWNLSSPQAAPANQMYALQIKLQELEQKETELNHSLSATLSAKQRADLALKTAQTQLNQIQTHVAEYQVQKDQLIKEIEGLTGRKQKLEAKLSTLQSKVQDLDQYRTELHQFIASAEPKRQQVENSSRSLQGAIGQLQTQISSLHEELGQLETQILERRHQKEFLDQELLTLRSELSAPSSPSPALLPSSPASDWTTFFSQLPQPEFKALTAIVEESNPAATLKQIAEDHLTMPALLIDSINERAIETIGDFVIDPNSGSVAPEYLTIVQQLLDRS
jgi:uncharacterized coiled-coil DUF342 family protein